MKAVDSLQDIKAEPKVKAAAKAKTETTKQDTPKKGSGGFGAPVQLSDKLAALLGESIMPRTEVRDATVMLGCISHLFIYSLITVGYEENMDIYQRKRFAKSGESSGDHVRREPDRSVWNQENRYVQDDQQDISGTLANELTFQFS